MRCTKYTLLNTLQCPMFDVSETIIYFNKIREYVARTCTGKEAEQFPPPLHSAHPRQPLAGMYSQH